MTVLTLILGGAVASLIHGNRMIEEARDITRVSQVIQSEVEALRTLTWNDLQAFPKHQWKQLTLQGTFALAYADKYTLYRWVAPLDWDADGQTDQIAVYLWVVWLSPRGDFRRQWHYARFTENGLNDYFYRAF